MAQKQGPYPPRHDPPQVRKIMNQKPEGDHRVDKIADKILRDQQRGDVESGLKK